jgi:hypothetical protein
MNSSRKTGMVFKVVSLELWDSCCQRKFSCYNRCLWLQKYRKIKMKILIVLAVALFSVGIIACGSAGTGSMSHIPHAKGSSHGFKGDEDDDEEFGVKNNMSPSVDGDADADNDIKDRLRGYHDSDDRNILAYGDSAGVADKLTLTNLVKLYYAAATAEDGERACSLVTPHYVRLIVEEFGGAGGPRYMRGKTCPVVMSSFFKHEHRLLSLGVEITSVRISGDQAFVLLGSSALPASYITLKHQGSAWRVEDLLGVPLP